MDYISVKETSKKFHLSERRIQKLCETNRIEGCKMVHGSDLPVFYFQCGHRNGFTVPAAVVRHDLRRHPDLLSGDQLSAGGQTEQAGACGSIEE